MELFARRRDLARTLYEIKEAQALDHSRDWVKLMNKLYILAAADAIRANFETVLHIHTLYTVKLTIKLFEEYITLVIKLEDPTTEYTNQDKIIDIFLSIHIYSFTGASSFIVLESTGDGAGGTKS